MKPNPTHLGPTYLPFYLHTCQLINHKCMMWSIAPIKAKTLHKGGAGGTHHHNDQTTRWSTLTQPTTQSLKTTQTSNYKNPNFAKRKRKRKRKTLHTMALTLFLNINSEQKKTQNHQTHLPTFSPNPPKHPNLGSMLIK